MAQKPSIQLSFSFVESDYPDEIESYIDEYIFERTKSDLEKQFNSFETSPILKDIFGNQYFSDEFIREIAGNRLKPDRELISEAKDLLDRYNERIDKHISKPIDEQYFANKELEWLHTNSYLETEAGNNYLDLDEDVRIGFNDGRYALIHGEPLDIEDMEEIASIIDEDIEYEHVLFGEGKAIPHMNGEPEEYSEYVKTSKDLPY